MLEPKLIIKILDHIQNIASKEDIITGILATMFDVSKNFTTKFFNHPNLFARENG